MKLGRTRALALVALVASVGAASTARAATDESPIKAEGGSASWAREHLTAEWQVGCGGWRTGITATGKAPGFEAWGGGVEMSFGVDIKSGVGLVANGRALFGRHDGGLYLDAMGGLAVQLRATTRLRFRLGATAGQLRDGTVHVLEVGGFLGMAIDLVQFADGRAAMMFGARLDVDGHPGAPPTIPGATLALAVGLGIRY